MINLISNDEDKTQVNFENFTRMLIFNNLI